jgi:hypothetical protein
MPAGPFSTTFARQTKEISMLGDRDAIATVAVKDLGIANHLISL